MSNALALAGVTSVLQHYLHNLYGTVASNFPAPVHVSCLAPDQVQQQLTSGTGNLQNQVNLFLHLVTHNPGWRNVDLPSLSSNGQTQTGNPPLALDLHYLLTVYGSEPWQSEALLGYALMMFHQSPVLTRNDVEKALNARSGSTYPYSGYPLNKTLGLCGLNDQSELLKITPESMSREEMAWLWTALKADYRLTFPFKVSVALMLPDLSPSLAFPVLQTSFRPPPAPPPPAIPPPAPQVVLPNAPSFLLSASYPSGQGVAQPNDQVTLSGEFLTGANRVMLTHVQLGISFHVAPDTVTAEQVQFTLPPLAPMPSAPPPLPPPPPPYPAGSVSGSGAMVGCDAEDRGAVHEHISLGGQLLAASGAVARVRAHRQQPRRHPNGLRAAGVGRPARATGAERHRERQCCLFHRRNPAGAQPAASVLRHLSLSAVDTDWPDVPGPDGCGWNQ